MRTRGKSIPDEARRAILAWEPGDATTLNDLACSLGVIPSSARTLRHRHKRGPRQREGLRDGNESRRPGRCGVEILYSPIDQFNVGNKFTMIDLESMVKYSAMPDGTAFEITPRDGEPYTVKMQGGELVEVKHDG